MEGYLHDRGGTKFLQNGGRIIFEDPIEKPLQVLHSNVGGTRQQPHKFWLVEGETTIRKSLSSMTLWVELKFHAYRVRFSSMAPFLPLETTTELYQEFFDNISKPVEI